jgi:hypothetical protein
VIGCAQCGNNSRIPDGVYDTAKRIVTQIAEAIPSGEREAYIAQIVALREILKSERARAQTQTDLEATHAAIEEEAPDLAPFLNNYLISGPQWNALVKVLLVGIAALLTVLVGPMAGAVPIVVKTALDEIDKLRATKDTRRPESVESKQKSRNQEKRERRTRRGE